MTARFTPHEPMLRVERAGLALGFAIVLMLSWPLRHHVVDDTFVHLQFARHLAQGSGPVFNPGEHVYGCTSPLWAALLADAMAVGWNGLAAARLLGLASALATVALFLQLLRRTVLLPELRGFATVAWSANAWMLQWATSGMETALAVALILAGFVAFTEGRQWGTRPVRTGALWALAALTRPEAGFLLLLWGVTLLVDANNRAGLRRMVYGIVPPAVIYGAWLLFARFYFGTFWPRTLLLHPRTGFDARQLLEELRIVTQTDGAMLVLLAAAVAFGGRVMWGRHPNAAQRALPWLWMLMLPVLFVARGIPARSRYLLLLLPVLEWLAWRSAGAWWLGAEPSSKARRNQATVFGFAAMTVMLLMNFNVYRRQVLLDTDRSTRMLRASLVEWGAWFGKHAPRDATIAAPEVGAIGFHSGRRVLDLTGLISPELEPRLRGDADPVAHFAFAGVARPLFIADRAPRAFDLMMRSPHANALAPLGRAPAAGEPRADSIYTFYRIDWSAFDTLGVSSPPATR